MKRSCALAALLATLTLPVAANYPIQVSVLLDAGVGPDGTISVTITNTGSIGGTLVRTFSPGASQRVRYTLIPIYVPPASGTTYSACADPCGVSINREWGQQYEFVEYVDNSGVPLSPVKKSQAAQSYNTQTCGGLGTLPMVEPAVTTTAPLPMPIEVIGQDCYVTRAQIPLLAGHASTSLRLWARIHAPGYNSTSRWDNKLCVQINSGAWICLTNANSAVVPSDEMKYYARADNAARNAHTETINTIGGYAQVRDYMITVPDGTVGSDDTTVTIGWRFNGTEGISSGARILEMTLVEASKTLSQIVVTSNSAVATSTSHGFSSGNDALVYLAPGIRMRFNGMRLLTAADTNTFTFAPCGTGDAACTSPNGTYTVPVKQDSSTVVATTQPVMYAARSLIAKSAFTQTDPTLWTAPGGADATRGGNLFKFGNAAGTGGQLNQLVNPNLPYFDNKFTNATCGGNVGCHTVTGKDLPYYNFSNWVLKQRTIFHGFTAQDGDDIAAHIRGLSITVPAKARPWNPPGQPCPGLSTTANDIMGGGGIDCVVTYDADMREYLAPGGSTATWVWNNWSDPRNIPLPLQMPDWKIGWLPVIHPADAFPSASFLTSSAYTYHQAALSTAGGAPQNGANAITPGDITSYAAQGYLNNLYPNYQDFGNARSIGGSSGNGEDELAGQFAPSIYPMLRRSVMQQKPLMAAWEFSVEYGLGALDATRQTNLKGAATATGGYLNFQLVPGGPGHGGQKVMDNGDHKTVISYHTAVDGQRATSDYQSRVWYDLAYILQSGNRWGTANSPIDNAYTNGFEKSEQVKRPTGIMGTLMTAIYTVQAGSNNANFENFSGVGTDYSAIINKLVTYDLRYPFAWMSSADRTQYANEALDLINAVTSAHTDTYWETIFTTQGYNTANAGSAWSQASAATGDHTAMLLTLFKVWGADSGKLTTYLNWAKTISNWSAHNFDDDIAAATGCPVYTFGDASVPPWLLCSNM